MRKTIREKMVGSGSYWKKRTARPCSAAYPPFKQLLRAFCSGATTPCDFFPFERGLFKRQGCCPLSLFSPAVYRAHSSGRFPHNRRRSPLPFGKSPLPGRSRSFFRKTGPGLRRSPGKGRSGFLCGYDGATSEKRTTGNRAPIGEYNSESKAYPGPAEWSYLLP